MKVVLSERLARQFDYSVLFRILQELERQLNALSEGKQTAYHTALASAPTTGTWGVGDWVKNTAPALQGNFGWVCVTGGTPGTWLPFGWVGGAVLLNNTGLEIYDTDASHGLTIKPGSNLSADRTLTVTTGDADRTLTLSGNATISGTHSGTSSGTNTGDQTATALIKLDAGVVTSAATLDISISSYTGTYKTLVLKLEDWHPDTDDVELWMRTAASAGVFDEGASDYGYAVSGSAVGSATTNLDAADIALVIAGGAGVARGQGNAAAESLSCEIRLHNFGGTTYNKKVTAVGSFIDTVPEPSTFHCAGQRISTSAIVGIRLLYESGNIGTGSWTLYGLVD